MPGAISDPIFAPNSSISFISRSVAVITASEPDRSLRSTSRSIRRMMSFSFSRSSSGQISPLKR